MQSEKRLPALDGIRGLAAIAVLIGHCAARGLLRIPGGAVIAEQGVVLFFCLSGFLMAYLYFDRPFNGRELLLYARHRIGRILPLFAAVVLICRLLWPPVSWLWVYKVDSLEVVAENLLFVHGTQVLWTIPVEIQFYAVFVALWFAYAQRRLWLALALLMAAVLPALIYGIVHQSDWNSLAQWMHFFLIGVVLAYILRHKADTVTRFFRTRAAALLPLLFIPLAILSIGHVRTALGVPVISTWFNPVAAAIPVLALVCTLGGIRPFTALAWPPLRWLGSISYGIYVFHFPVLMTLQNLLHPHGLRGGLMAFAATAALTFALAQASFVLFERPLRRWIAGPGADAPAPLKAA